MINIVASITVVIALKLAFLWAFVPERRREGSAEELISRGQIRESIVESHDGRSNGTSIPSELEVTNTSEDLQLHANRYAFSNFESYTEGR